MGLIALIKAGLEETFASTVTKVAADELRAWSPWIASRITTFALKKLPKHCRDRYKEEWASHLQDVPGNIGKPFVAFGFYAAARRIAAAEPDNIPALVWLIRHLLVLMIRLAESVQLLTDRRLKAIKEDPKWARAKLVRRLLIYPSPYIGFHLVSVLISTCEHLCKIPNVVPKDVS